MDAAVTRFQEIYKNRVLRFEATRESTALAQRQSIIKQQRRNSRHSIMMLKRKLTVGTLTPISSPAVKRGKEKPAVVQEDKIDHRREMLRKWQAEKQKLLAKQKNEKPLFKVHHVTTTSQFDLDKIYGQIKGKPIAKKRAGPQQFPLVASKTYQFKPPANIKPINLHTDVTKSSKSTNRPKKNIFEIVPSNRVTRSQCVVLPQLEEIPIRRRKVKTNHAAAAISSTVSEVPAKTNENNGKITNSEPVTPSNKSSSSTVYVSPFVTMSRGKENARKEFNRRSIRGGTDSASTSPKAAARYFYQLLNNQTKRLRNLCHDWNTYKNEQQPSEEACDMIDVAIGQTELLLTKKFQQFKGLVATCETGNSEMPVTCVDLHGFWDMVMIQVENLNKRFDNLEKLRENDWIEILPAGKPAQSKKPKKKVTKKSTTAGTSLSLKAAIQEARRKKGAATTNDEAIILCVGSTNTSEIMKGRTPRRSSLRVSTLTSEAKRAIGSPGLTMMTVTQAAKSAEKLMSTTPIVNNKRTSPKSILKSQKSKSTGRKAKVVLFNETKSSTEDEDQENNPNSSNSIYYSPISTPKRRSMRLAKGKRLNP